MKEYLSKEAVLNLIEHNDKVCHYADERYENVVYATAQAICRAVLEMPAADIAELKEAKQLLKVAVNDIQDILHYANSISVCFHCAHRIDTCYGHPACKDRAKWEHLEEALKLIGEDKEE